MTDPSGVRLFAILAREAHVGIIFRRGPSKQVLLIRWDTARDRFEEGQWFKGRIYERRCDLSPSGDKLIYFAAKFKGPLYSWTAVSRPPYLTALALWPKGDTWGGGGLFESESTILLNHARGKFELAEGFTLPGRVKIHYPGIHAGMGEDDPIYHRRLTRDGWVRTSEGSETRSAMDGPFWITYDPPRVYVKQPRRGRRLGLEMRIRGIKERAGPWYVVEHRLVGAEGAVLLDLGRSDWADWDHNGDLLFARFGRLYRLRRAELNGSGAATLERALLLADFRAKSFREKIAPEAARHW